MPKMQFAQKTTIIAVLLLSACQQSMPNEQPDTAQTSEPVFTSEPKVVQQQFGDLTIEIRNTSKNNWCFAEFMLKRGDAILQQYEAKADPLGGCAGLFLPKTQPRKDRIVFSKFGDYQGRVFVIAPNGRIEEMKGGIFYVSPDGHYLFAYHDSDAIGLTVFDLETMTLLYDEAWENTDYLGDCFRLNGQYVVELPVEDGEEAPQGSAKIAAFDFQNKQWGTPVLIPQDSLVTATKLQSYNRFTTEDCNCGR